MTPLSLDALIVTHETRRGGRSGGGGGGGWQWAAPQFGAKPVDQGVSRIIDAMDGLQIETTGQFLMIPTAGGAAKEMPW